MYWGGRHKDEQKASGGPSCSWFSASQTGQFIGGAQLWEGVTFPALSNMSRGAFGFPCCEEEWQLHTVHSLSHSYQDSNKNPARDQVCRTQEIYKWAPRGICPTQAWLALEQNSRWHRRTEGSFASQTSHSRLSPRDMGFCHWEKRHPTLKLPHLESSFYYCFEVNKDCLVTYAFDPTPCVLLFWTKGKKGIKGIGCVLMPGVLSVSLASQEHRGNTVRAWRSACCFLLAREKLHTISNYCI